MASTLSAGEEATQEEAEATQGTNDSDGFKDVSIESTNWATAETTAHEHDSIIMNDSDWTIPESAEWKKTQIPDQTILPSSLKLDEIDMHILGPESTLSVPANASLLERRTSVDMSVSSLSPTDSTIALRDLPVWVDFADSLHLTKLPDIHHRVIRSDRMRKPSFVEVNQVVVFYY